MAWQDKVIEPGPAGPVPGKPHIRLSSQLVEVSPYALGWVNKGNRVWQMPNGEMHTFAPGEPMTLKVVWASR